MFQVPIGQQDPYNGSQTKTEQETNMRSTGQFSAPYDFILNNLGFYVLAGANVFDIATIFNQGWFEFKILQKQQFMGHFQRHPSGMGVTGMTTATSQQNWINGIADPKAVWWFGDWKKYIPPLTSFTLNINFQRDVSAVLQCGLGHVGESAGRCEGEAVRYRHRVQRGDVAHPATQRGGGRQRNQTALHHERYQ